MSKPVGTRILLLRGISKRHVTLLGHRADRCRRETVPTKMRVEHGRFRLPRVHRGRLFRRGDLSTALGGHQQPRSQFADHCTERHLLGTGTVFGSEGAMRPIGDDGRAENQRSVLRSSIRDRLCGRLRSSRQRRQSDIFDVTGPSHESSTRRQRVRVRSEPRFFRRRSKSDAAHGLDDDRGAV